MRECTECFLVQGDPVRDVLLGYKRIGFGVGKYAGIGGKVEPNETVIEAAVRELDEEIGVRVDTSWLIVAGRLVFEYPANPSWNQVVHVFLTTRWEGEPKEGIEMLPGWYPVGALPLDRMWNDAPYWLPQVLAGHPVRAHFSYATDNETVLEAIFDE